MKGNETKTEIRMTELVRRKTRIRRKLLEEVSQNGRYSAD